MHEVGAVITLPGQTCIVFSFREILDLSNVHIISRTSIHFISHQAALSRE